MRRSLFTTPIASFVILTACATAPDSQNEPSILSFGGSFTADLSEGDDRARWRRGDYTVTSGVQRSRYTPENLEFGDDGLVISISPQPTEDGYYNTGEYQTIGRYGDGRFEAAIRPAAGSGLVTSFFLYSGGSGIDGTGEITVQFAGRNTDQVRFSYLRNGHPRYSHVQDLPFNAAEETHVYGFERENGVLNWLIDGVVVHAAPEDAPPIPTEDANLVVNTWAAEAGASEIAGALDFAETRHALIACISFTLPGDSHVSCGDSPE